MCVSVIEFNCLRKTAGERDLCDDWVTSRSVLLTKKEEEESFGHVVDGMIRQTVSRHVCLFQ